MRNILRNKKQQGATKFNLKSKFMNSIGEVKMDIQIEKLEQFFFIFHVLFKTFKMFQNNCCL